MSEHTFDRDNAVHIDQLNALLAGLILDVNGHLYDAEQRLCGSLRVNFHKQWILTLYIVRKTVYLTVASDN